MRNLPAGQGDRDSVGVLQQRPSQGWGSAADLTDIRFATGAFLDRLVTVANWRRDDLATVIQAVQISANGDLYSRHEGRAAAMTEALSGQAARGVSCHFPAPGQVAPATQVAAQVRRDLGVAPVTVQGRTVTVAGAGWATAAWFVANADRLGIDSVDYAGGRWRRGKGWQDRSASGAGGVVASLAG